MNRSLGYFSVALLIGLLAGGCERAKGPNTVAKDVNSATQNANADSAKAEEKMAKTDAEGRRNVDLAKCEALSGDRQSACKDRANATYDMAVAQAKQERASTDPRR